MGTMKVKGNKAALAKAAKTDPGTFKEYDGEIPPNGVYRLKLRTMETKINSAGDPCIGSMLVIDEPAKKGAVTNFKSKYNGAVVRGSTNMSAEHPQFFNGFMAALGIPKAKWTAVWSMGFKTTDRQGKNDLVASIGGRTLEQMCADCVYAKVYMEEGGINKATRKKYPDKLSVGTWLTSNDIVSNPADADADEEDPDSEEEYEEDPEGEEEESEEDPEEGDADEEAYEERQVELEGMTRAALKALLKPLGSELRVTAKVTGEDIVEEILSLEFPEDEEGVDEEDEPEEEEEEEDPDSDLADLDRAGLKALIKEDGLDVRVVKSMSDEDIRMAVLSARGEDSDEEEEEYPPAKPFAKRRSKSTAGEPPF